MTVSATLEGARVVAAIAAVDQRRFPMRLVAAIAFKLPHHFRARVRVVRVDVLVIYDVVCGPCDDLCVTGVLIGDMAIEARLVFNPQRWHARTGDGPHVCLLQRLQVSMAIQTLQTLLRMGIGQQAGILQRLHLRIQVTQRTVRIGAPGDG